jgi:ABC-type polar amino acid transport system ATPase subunit
MAAVVKTLTLSGVTVRRGGRQLLDQVSFAANAGEVLAIMGASGSGKTTILRAIGGLEPIAAGSIDVNGVRLAAGALPRGAHLRDLHRRVGIVFQFHHLFAHMTALHNVWLAPVHVLGRPHAAAERAARGLLDDLGVGHRADAMPHELSGGEAQRVAIARALAVEPPVLLMDEPTASLDPARRDDLAATLQRLASAGRTIVVATHDGGFARACADTVVVISAGRLAREGRSSNVLE